MIQDIDVKAMKKNAFRVSKERGMTASRVRVPGGLVSAKSMARIVEIAEEYGRGEIFLTNRQGVEIPGIHMEDMPKVNEKLQAIIEDTKINQEDTSQGYLASGTRNVVACPGKRLCPFGCYDTTAFAQRMDHEIFPNNRHVKVAFTGCSNDCAHVALNDFGIIGMTEPQYDPNRCIGCGQCVDWCQRRSVSALRLEKGKVVRDEDRCIGCGVCVVYCPTRAWTRSHEHYFRVKIMGRTGKQNPRLAQDWLRWVDEDSIVKIVKNTYAFIEEYTDPNTGATTERFKVPEDKPIRLAGMATSVQKKTTKKGDAMAIVTLEDMEAETSLVIFPKTYKECAATLAGEVDPETGESTGDIFIKVVGRLERGDRGDQLICTSVEPLELNDKTNRPKVLEINMPANLLTRGRMDNLGEILGRYPGLDRVELRVESATGDVMRMELPTRIDAHNMVLMAEVIDLIGRSGHVKVA